MISAACRRGRAAIFVAFIGAFAMAQERTAEDEAVDAIRRLADIGPQDQQRIRNWVQIQVDRLAAAQKPPTPEGIDGPALKGFRDKFRQQQANSANTPQFKTQLAGQTAAVAVSEVAKPATRATVAAALAQALVDLDSPETFPGLLALFKSKAQAARYLAARGLTAQKTAIAADKERLESAIAALREAALVETNGPVRARIYEALSHPAQAGQVVDDFVAILDRRLAERRAGNHREDGAELAAWEFFRAPSVLTALTPDQRVELVRRAAVFLRLAAARYNDPALAPPTSDPNAPDPGYYERDDVERLLDALEEVIERASGASGGKIREELNTNGWDGRATVVRESHKWIGDPESKTKGSLNEAPWEIPLGAP